MKLEQVREIANAVLYEGYLLYPYRHSAIKNRQRWTIGVIYPHAYSAANGSIEPWSMHTECLIAGQGNEDVTLHIHVRFLHLLLQTTTQVEPASAASNPRYDGAWSLAGSMAHEPFEEGIEREVTLIDCSLRDLVASQRVVEIDLPGQRIIEDSDETSHATSEREQLPISGTVVVAAEAVGQNLFKLRIHIENRTPETGSLAGRHNVVFLQSFVSTHTILQVQHGEFISLLEPPDALQAVAQSCQNLHTWPVLVGNEGERDIMLSSPIILYDYPQIAPESPGNLFDGTEIDEILTLRILTLTEEEKEQMRRGDKRVREMLERTEALTPEQLMKLHGTIRSLHPIPEGDMS